MTKNRTQKPWGAEFLIECNEHYAVKILLIKQGYRLSLQYHKRKHETMYIVDGHGKISLDGVDTLYTKGQSIIIPPGVVHRVKAIDGTTILEVSTPELDDIVRLEDDYGRTN